MSWSTALLVIVAGVAALSAACWLGGAPKAAAFFGTLDVIVAMGGYAWEQVGSQEDLSDNHWRRR